MTANQFTPEQQHAHTLLNANEDRFNKARAASRFDRYDHAAIIIDRRSPGADYVMGKINELKLWPPLNGQDVPLVVLSRQLAIAVIGYPIAESVESCHPLMTPVVVVLPTSTIVLHTGAPAPTGTA